MYVLSKNVLTVSNDKVMARLPLLRAHTAQLLEEPLQVQVAQSRELLGPSAQYQWLTLPGEVAALTWAVGERERLAQFPMDADVGFRDSPGSLHSEDRGSVPGGDPGVRRMGLPSRRGEPGGLEPAWHPDEGGHVKSSGSVRIS